MKIIAIDLGKFNSMICFYDSNTQRTEFLTAATNREYLAKVFEQYPCELVVMEACSASGWVSELCEEFGLKTLVCSTHEEAWRWRNVSRKTDRDDALKLARLAAMGQLKATHVPTRKMREYRSLNHYRKRLVGESCNEVGFWRRVPLRVVSCEQEKKKARRGRQANTSLIRTN